MAAAAAAIAIFACILPVSSEIIVHLESFDSTLGILLLPAVAYFFASNSIERRERESENLLAVAFTTYPIASTPANYTKEEKRRREKHTAKNTANKNTNNNYSTFVYTNTCSTHIV